MSQLSHLRNLIIIVHYEETPAISSELSSICTKENKKKTADNYLKMSRELERGQTLHDLLRKGMNEGEGSACRDVETSAILVKELHT